MECLVVTDDQAKVIAGSRKPIAIRDQRGTCVGYVEPEISEEEIAILKARIASDQPRYTTKQVLEYLHSLERS